MFLFLLSLLPFCIYSNLDGGNDIIAVNYKLTNILRDGIKNKYYPGVAAIAGNADNILYNNNLGYYTYIDDEMNEHDLNSVHPISKDTFFDIASVSKVIATTSAVALLVQNGYINVDDYVYKYMDDIEFKSHNKDLITVKHLLTHSSGLNGDPSPWYWEIEFPCPNTKDVYPQQDTSCVEIIYNNLLNSTLTAEPGTTYIYSDIGFLILQYMIGTVVKNEHLIEEASESFRKCPYYTQTSIYHAETDKQSRDHDYTVHMSAMNHIDLICYFEAYVRSEIFNFKPSGDSIRNTFGSDTMIHKSELDVLMPNTHYTSYGLNVNDFAPTMNDTVGTYIYNGI